MPWTIERTVLSGPVFFPRTRPMIWLRFSGLYTSVTLAVPQYKKGLNEVRDTSGEKRGDRVADLPGDLHFGASELEVVWEGLQTRRLSVCNRAILNWMQVAPLLRFEELRPNRERRPIPPETAEEVRAAGSLANPAFWSKVWCPPL